MRYKITYAALNERYRKESFNFLLHLFENEVREKYHPIVGKK
jgi:hypothetical protein